MRRITFDSSISRGVDINMSPMIDCVFLLLIFFIVTTVFEKRSGVDIDKPRAVTADQLRQQSLVIALDAGGRILYDGHEIGLNSVRGLVARRLNGRDMGVVIAADRAVSTGKLIELMDECRRGGAKRVSVGTERTAGKGEVTR